jgi:hypothetical protein
MARDTWKSEKLGYLDRRFGAGQDTRRWKNGFWVAGYMSACIFGGLCLVSSLYGLYTLIFWEQSDVGGAFSDFPLRLTPPKG